MGYLFKYFFIEFTERNMKYSLPNTVGKNQSATNCTKPATRKFPPRRSSWFDLICAEPAKKCRTLRYPAIAYDRPKLRSNHSPHHQRFKTTSSKTLAAKIKETANQSELTEYTRIVRQTMCSAHSKGVRNPQLS